MKHKSSLSSVSIRKFAEDPTSYVEGIDVNGAFALVDDDETVQAVVTHPGIDTWCAEETHDAAPAASKIAFLDLATILSSEAATSPILKNGASLDLSLDHDITITLRNIRSASIAALHENLGEVFAFLEESHGAVFLLSSDTNEPNSVRLVLHPEALANVPARVAKAVRILPGSDLARVGESLIKLNDLHTGAKMK